MQIAANFLFSEKYYVFQKSKQVMDVFEQIKEQVSNTDQSIIDIVRQIEIENNFEYFVANEAMEMIYANRAFLSPGDHMEPPMPGEKQFDFRNYPTRDYQADHPTISKTNMMNGDRLRLLGKVTTKDGEAYYIAIRLSVKSISEELRTTNMFILYISTFALFAGGLLVYFMARQLSKPIVEMSRVAVNVSNLDFSTRVSNNHLRDEIGSLATNINIMSERLQNNITYLQEANKKLEEDNEYMNMVDEQRKEFIANISHELKTPLAILTGYTEMLNTDVPGIDKSFYYDTILDETRKMDVLIKNLLGLTNMENSLAQLQTEPVSLAELTERICRKSEILMKNKGVNYEFRAETCSMVLGDAYYLEEAISNFLSNAINYTEPGRNISVLVRQEDKEVMVSVFNEGINIDEKHLDKIWNSFYREDKSRTRTSQNNVGLGLYIVQSIMTAHHGRYGVKNRENGVEFWLSLKEIE